MQDGGRHVVVVESPAKARTIGAWLGPPYRVMATRGHVRDLPAKAGSVDPGDGFSMVYETGKAAARTLGAIARALENAEGLILATDPDREGEAIAWQVLDWLTVRDAIGARRVERATFHEVTEEAVRAALANPRGIDMDLVRAWQARRALDYLVGYGLSPVLWRKLPGCRSAGRVQSVALRLICEREAGIEAFVPRRYWTVEAEAAGKDGIGLPRGSGGPSISRNCPAIPLPPSPRSHDPFPTAIRRGIRQVPRRISPPEVAPLPSTRSLVRTSAARLHPLANAQTSLCIAMPGQTAPFKPAARRLAVLPNPSIERSIVIIASEDSPCRAASHCCK